MNLNKSYWEERYREESWGWDIGYASTPLKNYFDQLQNKAIRILIPGAGHGYEAVYLHRQGFSDITVLDIARKPLEKIREATPDFPEERLLETDFFNYGQSGFDLIVEQTFYCALDPALRDPYVHKMRELLKTGGTLAGLLFNFPLTESGPPFGGSEEEYRQRFGPYFKLKTLEPCVNSIPPREGKELFFIFERK